MHAGHILRSSELLCRGMEEKYRVITALVVEREKAPRRERHGHQELRGANEVITALFAFKEVKKREVKTESFHLPGWVGCC